MHQHAMPMELRQIWRVRCLIMQLHQHRQLPVLEPELLQLLLCAPVADLVWAISSCSR